MITEVAKFPNIPEPVQFYIGKSQAENHGVLDMAKPEDMWFHLGGVSSAHIIGVVPVGLERKYLKYIVKHGAHLCKKHTTKVANQKNVAVLYTRVRNVQKTSKPGEVICSESSILIC